MLGDPPDISVDIAPWGTFNSDGSTYDSAGCGGNDLGMLVRREGGGVCRFSVSYSLSLTLALTAQVHHPVNHAVGGPTSLICSFLFPFSLGNRTVLTRGANLLLLCDAGSRSRRGRIHELVRFRVLFRRRMLRSGGPRLGYDNGSCVRENVRLTELVDGVLLLMRRRTTASKGLLSISQLVLLPS